MIKIDPATRERLAKYVGPDGRLIMDESLPDDVKGAFEYFNAAGVNVLDLADDKLHLRPIEEGPNEEIESADEGEEEFVVLSPDGVEQGTITNENIEPELSNNEPLSPEQVAKMNQDLEDLDSLF